MQRLRRLSWKLGCLMAAAFLVVFGRWYYLEGLANPFFIDPSWPELTTVALDDSERLIVCGDNIHVSHEHPNARHFEVVIAAGGSSVSPMCIASIYQEGDTHFVRGFVSVDQGQNWKGEYELLPRRGISVADPTVEIADDGSTYLVAMDSLGEGNLDGLELAIRDGSVGTWSAQRLCDFGLDRPWITLQKQNAGNSNLLVIGQANEASLLTYDLADLRPTGRSSTQLGLVSCRPARALAWKTVEPIAIVQNRFPTWNGRVRSTIPQIIKLETNSDGVLEPSEKIGAEWQYSRGKAGSAIHTMFPATACNPDAGEHADHGYCVWAASLSSHPDDECLLVSRSTDRGQSWERPQLLSEQDLEAAANGRYLSFMPEVAVNKNGVVGVVWYDRRGMEASTTEEIAPNTTRTSFVGQNVRFRASVDGGESWLPSVQVNSIETFASYNVGHTLGIATDASGRFHATWIDARTGVPQVWSAAIRVKEHTITDE
ncbi:MAG: hypothetical protein AAF802_03155 [Planctomycetota bacterium]